MLNPHDFVLSETVIAAPPLVPEIRLHLASEVVPLWQATETNLTERGLPPPYWAFAWPGGQALARYLLDNPDLVSGKRVLDFAAGSGLAAIAAVKAGAAIIDEREQRPKTVARQQLRTKESLQSLSAIIGDRDLPVNMFRSLEGDGNVLDVLKEALSLPPRDAHRRG